MFVYIFDFISNITDFINNSNYTYVDDEDLTLMVPQNSNIMVFSDQLFEYYPNSSDIEIETEADVVGLSIMIAMVGLLCCACGYLMHKVDSKKRIVELEIPPSYTIKDV
jgi:hypothetical protein